MDRTKDTGLKMDDKMLEYRLYRMRQTLDRIPEYSDVFRFFEKVIRLRCEYTAVLREIPHPAVGNGTKAKARLQQGIPLMDKGGIRLDLDCMKSYFAALFDLVSENSPLDLDFIGAALQSDPGRPLCDIIDEIIRNQPLCQVEVLQFLMNETVNPLLRIYAENFRNKALFDQWSEGFCPLCGGMPAMGVILPDSGRRRLVCADCCTEWGFPRIKCPHCGNEDQGTLSYIKIDTDADCRIEVCNACRHYLKTLTPSGVSQLPVYDIENLATIHLDLIAGRQGYASAGMPVMPARPGPESPRAIH